jgi:hypothetical protein
MKVLRLYAKKQMPLTDLVPNHIHHSQPVWHRLRFQSRCREQPANLLSRLHKLFGIEEAESAAAKAGRVEGPVRDIGDEVVVHEGDVALAHGIDEVGPKVRPRRESRRLIFPDDAGEVDIVSNEQVIRVETSVGVFDEDGSADVAFLNGQGDGFASVDGLSICIDEFELFQFFLLEAVEEALKVFW